MIYALVIATVLVIAYLVWTLVDDFRFVRKMESRVASDYVANVDRWAASARAYVFKVRMAQTRENLIRMMSAEQ